MKHAPADILRGPDIADRALVVLFLLGIYLNIALRLSQSVPVPSILAGAAGLLLLLKHSSRINDRLILAFLAVFVITLLSILTAPDYAYFGERLKGFIQFGYSLIIACGFFFAVTLYRREQLAFVFLVFCVVILLGCTLENTVTPFRELSDSFRALVFDTGIYSADLRDQYLYGRIRPKLFTSEPSFVSFMFTLSAFAWYVLSLRRGKTFLYLLLLAGGYMAIRGPTLFLGVALIPVYQVFLTSRHGRGRADGSNILRVAVALFLAGLLAVMGLAVGSMLFEERIADIFSGRDPSFFARIVAPFLVAKDIIIEHPLAGAGLTGWEFIEDRVTRIYTSSTWLALDFRFDNAAHAITNYFWLHWIFFGLFWGVILIVALSMLLRQLGVSNILFAWAVWAVFGQAAGGYVDPRAWTVLFVAAALAVIHSREGHRMSARARMPAPVIRTIGAGWR